MDLYEILQALKASKSKNEYFEALAKFTSEPEKQLGASEMECVKAIRRFVFESDTEEILTAILITLSLQNNMLINIIASDPMLLMKIIRGGHKG